MVRKTASFFFVELGFELRALILQSKHYLLSHISAYFALEFWRWGLVNPFLPRWFPTEILPLSSSQLARI
jgi:hypothetical protein